MRNVFFFHVNLFFFNETLQLAATCKQIKKKKILVAVRFITQCVFFPNKSCSSYIFFFPHVFQQAFLQQRKTQSLCEKASLVRFKKKTNPQKEQKKQPQNTPPQRKTNKHKKNKNPENKKKSFKPDLQDLTLKSR